jgi:hypothetical protein
MRDTSILQQGVFARASQQVFTILLVVICFTSCEKSISFDLDASDPKLVVDATIESGQPPVVILSRSLDYFSEISPQILASSFVHNADIRISNGLVTQTLKEYAVKTPLNLDVFYYTIDSANQGQIFLGETGKKYSLAIAVDGRQYNSVTSIPAGGTVIDSIWWRKSPGNPDTNQVILVCKVTDPPGFGNYFRYFTRTGRGPFLPGLNSVFDDQVVDGTTYTTSVDKGIDRNEKLELEDYAFFNRGDTVTLKISNIDKSTFDFWRTMEFSYSSIGNPFSTPTKVLGNVSGGALGYFGGYAVQSKTLVIPR